MSSSAPGAMSSSAAGLGDTAAVGPGPSGATVDQRAIPDDELDCADFRAHGAQTPGDTSPFVVQPGETYHCFYFTGPWDGPVQGVRVEDIKGTLGVVHHELLYSLSTAHSDGSSEECVGFHLDGTLIPGAGLETLPADTGFEVPAGPDTSFLLEMHYINTGEAAVTDTTGIRLCAAKHPLPRTASLTWLGTEDIELSPRQQGVATGTCVPSRDGLTADEPIEIFMLAPHMHTFGRRAQVYAHRADGSTDLLLDTPYDYASPMDYTVRASLQAGDTLETRCLYDNSSDHTVTYGATIADEMCYVFAMAYPAGALHHPSLSLVGATNTCLW